MKTSSLLASIAAFTVVAIGVISLVSPSRSLGATILTTNSSDSLTTFRTNVNTSLTNLNTDKLELSDMDALSKGFFFSTTSADYWGSIEGYATFAYPFPSNATNTALTFSAGIVADVTGNLAGNASTATALALNGTNCSAGHYPLGVDAQGNAEDCTAASGGSSFDYPFPSDATSTLLSFNNGLEATSASSTVFLVASGTPPTTGYTFTEDTDTGIASSLANTLFFYLGGIPYFTMDATRLLVSASANIESSFNGGFWLESAAGTVSAPTYSFRNDTNTGLWTPGADTVAVTAGGANSALFGSASSTILGSLTATGKATTSGNHAFGSVRIPSLGTPAGTFLAADANGNIIATTTPEAGGGGTIPQTDFDTAATNGSVFQIYNMTDGDVLMLHSTSNTLASDCDSGNRTYSAMLLKQSGFAASSTVAEAGGTSANNGTCSISLVYRHIATTTETVTVEAQGVSTAQAGTISLLGTMFSD